jgi:hypothetical protein
MDQGRMWGRRGGYERVEVRRGEVRERTDVPLQFPPHIRDSPQTLPLDIRSSSDIVPSPSVPVICRFHHRFRRFRHCLSFSSFAVAAASIYRYRRRSKLSVLHGKLTQPLPLHLGSSFPPPNFERSYSFDCCHYHIPHTYRTCTLNE